MRDAGRINAQDKGLDSFGPRETSSGNNPTCCLGLGLIMITGESPVRLSVFTPRDYFLLLVPLWGALPPPYISWRGGLHMES